MLKGRWGPFKNHFLDPKFGKVFYKNVYRNIKDPKLPKQYYGKTKQEV